MKAKTKRLKQLGVVSEWLAWARPELEQATATQGRPPVFSLLIAVEQLVEYCKLLEAEGAE